MEDYHVIPSLLHDARLKSLEFDDSLAKLRLVFSCLRRNPNGSPIDSPVEICLDGVEEIIAYYHPPNVEVRPSKFVVGEEISAAELKAWTRQPNEAYLSINSEQADFIYATSCVQRQLVGDGVHRNSNLSIHLAWDAHSHSEDAVATRIRVACDSIHVTSIGMLLDDWRRQFEAWWEGWREHWQDKDTEATTDQKSVQEDMFIPAGESDAPDLTYRPPMKEVLQLSESDIPLDLLEPLRSFHEGVLKRDWQNTAIAYPNFDQTVDERALQLGEAYLSDDYGRWLYIRQVDSWWIEGQRACVVIRGIEHTMPDGEDPAEDRETVVTYGLLKRNGRWTISTWSQGWPQYGSAESSDKSEAWKSEWKPTDD